MEKSHYIILNNSHLRKKNTFIWTGIIDIDGKMLKNESVNIEEYYSWFNEFDNNYSSYLIDKNEFEKGITNILKTKFFKYVDYEKGIQYQKETNKKSGRLNNKSNLYIFSDMDEALFANEQYQKGVLFFMTDLNHLFEYRTYMNNIRILRINQSFKTIFGDSVELQTLNFDEIINPCFELNKSKSYKMKSSQKYIDILNKKKMEKSETVLDNGMILISNDKKLNKNDVPEIYDYSIEEYDFVSNK